MDIGGLSVSALNGYATRQLHQIESLGALFAERVAEPLLIKNPLPLPTPNAIILTRWIGGGVFGVVFPDGAGGNLTGWITMAHAMRANPGLTPSGTISSEPWDRNISTKRDHLLPQPATLRERAQRTGTEMAQRLLTQFPNRIDLSPSFDLEMMDQGKILEIAAEHLRPLSKEISDGLSIAALSKADDAAVNRLIGDIANSLIRKVVIEHALRTFTQERIRQAREEFSQGHATSAIRKLVDLASQVTTTVLTPLARNTVFKDPRATAPEKEVRQQCGIGLSIALTQRREYAELWKHLSESERTRIVADISKRAWSEAVRAYVARN
jgi:hypothetical protein